MQLLSSPPPQGEELREALHEYATEYDVSIVPCRPDKTPYVTEWRNLQERPNTEQELENWLDHEGLWGAVTGRLFNVVDIDSHKDPQHLDWAKEHLPYTPLKGASQNGGQHWYYRATDLDVPTTQFDGIDTRGRGGYVCFAGGRYAMAWHGDSSFHGFDDLPALEPQHLYLLQCRRQVKDSGGGDWWSRMLKRTGQMVAHGESDEAIYALAESVTEPGWTVEETLKDLRKMVKGAREKGWSPDDSSPIPVRSMTDAFAIEKDKPTEFLGEGFIAAGFRVFLIGAPKIGKSQFVLQMLSTAAVGGSFLGYKWNQPHRVLWLQAEIRGPYVGVRLRPMYDSFTTQEQQLLSRNFLWTERGDIDLVDNFERIRTLIKTVKPSLIAIDPLSNFFGGDESNNAEVNGFLKRVNWLVDEKNLGFSQPPAVILVHHTRKGAKESDGFEGARGASSMSGWMDSGMMLTKHDDGVKLSFMCRNGKWPRDRVIRLRDDTMKFAEVRTTDESFN